MLAYAAHRRPHRRISPAALTTIIGGHALAIAFLITAKMEVNPFVPEPPIEIEAIPLPPEPAPQPEPQAEPQTQQTVRETFVAPPVQPIEIDTGGPVFEAGASTNEIVPDVGPIIDTPPGPIAADPPQLAVKIAARPLTPAEYLRPPYPDSKRRLEEEAVLKLRLRIDERGRVTAVDPVGDADPVFLAAARQHLLRHWRYRPATEDGRAVASTMTVTLRFELEE